MKEIFISAAKYRKLESEQGVNTALDTLLKDIGSDGKLTTGPYLFDPSQTRAAALDVGVTVDGGLGNIMGTGRDLAEAKADLLHRMLTPEATVPSFYDTSTARLAVGDVFDPKIKVKVGP